MRRSVFTALPLAFFASFSTAQTLPQAMQQALQAHPEVQAGINGRLAADQQVRIAQGGYLPRVCKNTFLSCVLQPIAPRRGDFPIIYHDQRR